MKGILADTNIEGHVDYFVAVMQGEPWRLFWDDLRLQYLRFSNVGLKPNSVDSRVWETCQQDELVLITDNRNEDGADSLEATIWSRNTPSSLPVVTVANVPQLRQSRAYADRVVDKLLDFLMRMDSLRWTPTFGQKKALP